MFKILTLIGIIFTGNIFGSQFTQDSLAEFIIERRIICASAFEMTARLASVGTAEELNASLINQFTEMEKELGCCDQLKLKCIDTVEKATEARNYYKKAKDSLTELRNNLVN